MLALATLIASSGCDTSIDHIDLSGPFHLPGEPPVISSVQWTHESDCDPSDYYITVTVVIVATDPDTDPSDLSYIGFVGRCGFAGPGGAVTQGAFKSATGVITCVPIFGGVYEGIAQVFDGDGHSDEVKFSFSRCQDGEKRP
jgi:hypothetical protein